MTQNWVVGVDASRMPSTRLYSQESEMQRVRGATTFVVPFVDTAKMAQDVPKLLLVARHE